MNTKKQAKQDARDWVEGELQRMRFSNEIYRKGNENEKYRQQFTETYNEEMDRTNQAIEAEYVMPTSRSIEPTTVIASAFIIYVVHELGYDKVVVQRVKQTYGDVKHRVRAWRNRRRFQAV